MRPLVVVDVANVVGSVPDGWWRDRAEATRRLRDRLVGLAEAGLAEWPAGGSSLEVVLVVEGAAKGVGSVPGVDVVAAGGAGDDTIVEQVAAAQGLRPCLVITADRELRRRVMELGAETLGPRTVR